MPKEINRIVKVSNTKLEVVAGDIADQGDMEAVVNAANADLRTGGGVAGALHRAAGPKLAEEGAKYAPIKPGQAVITKGYNLPNPYVIHCLGPVYGRDKPEGKLLANCYRNALSLADDNGIESVAFPAISTGAFGYPFEEATEIAISTVKETCEELKEVEKIRFVLFDQSQKEFYSNQLK